LIRKAVPSVLSEAQGEKCDFHLAHLKPHFHVRKEVGDGKH
jgi:hypothetical protein